jgi:hypothetical protein
MAAYDKLPPTARKALQEAAFSWAVQPIRTRHNRGKKGFRTGAEIAATVARWDTQKIKKDAKAVWGRNPNEFAPRPLRNAVHEKDASRRRQKGETTA